MTRGLRPFVWYDVFTDRAFAGNALAVFPDGAGLADDEMAHIAREHERVGDHVRAPGGRCHHDPPGEDLHTDP